MIKILTIFIGLWFILPTETFADICIPESLEVTSLRGRVIDVFSKGEEPLSKASVKLRSAIDPDRVIKTAKVDENGEFDFKGIKYGTYILSVTYPQLARLDVRIFFIKEKEKTNPGQAIIFSLGSNFNEPCGGSKAFLRTLQAESSDYKKIRKLLYAMEIQEFDTKPLAALFRLGDEHIKELIQALDDPAPDIRLRSQIIIRYLNNQEGMKALEDRYKRHQEQSIAGTKLVNEDDYVPFTSSEKDLAKTVLRKAFFLSKEEKQQTTARLLAMSDSKDKALVQLYVNQGVLMERWYHITLHKKGQFWEFITSSMVGNS